jgi:multiple sugar transport system ATP-binding protein
MVFQSYALYPQKTVYENIAFPLRLRRIHRPECDRLVREVAEQLEISHLLDRKPNQLSGGQRQRVALGRAIVRKPSVFLMDEPLSNLDATLRVSMRALIKKLHYSVATTFVYVTHDQAEAMTLADRIVVMDKGLVQQIGTPGEVYNSPCNMFVAGFLGSPQMNFIEGRIVGDGNGLAFSTPTVQMPLPKRWNGCLMGRQGHEMVLGVRPEDVSLGGNAAEGMALTGRCLLTAPLGSETYVHVANGGSEFVFRIDKDFTPGIGQDVTLCLRGDRVHLFDRPSGEAVTPAVVA